MNNNQPVLQKPSQFAELALFKMIWARSDKKSFITGTWLRDYFNTPLWFDCFAHVLAKGQNKYPLFRHYAKNIILLDPTQHRLLDFSTEEERISYALDIEEKGGHCDWQKLKDLEVELQKEYKLYFPTTKGLMIGVKYDMWDIQQIVGHLNKVYFDSLKK